MKLLHPVGIHALGANTAVGLSASATCAAMRAGISGFRETPYRTTYGEHVIGAPVPGVTASNLGIPYLAALAAPAIAECLEALPDLDDSRVRVYFGTQKVDTHISLAQTADHLRAALVDEFTRLGSAPFRRSFDFEVVAEGDMSFAHSLIRASILLEEGQLDYAVIGGAESYLTSTRLRHLERQRRLKTRRNSDGLIPGEGSCFIAAAGIRARRVAKAIVQSLVIENEQAILQGAPNRGEAWTQCIRKAVADARISYQDIGFRPTNLTGERLQSLEEGLAIMRCFLEPMSLPRTWNLASSVGSIGAASGALMAAWAVAAFERGYAPGETALCQSFADDGQRAVCVLQAASTQTNLVS